MATAVGVPLRGARRRTSSGSTQLPRLAGSANSHSYSQPMIRLSCGMPGLAK